ncbi:MAG: acetolactate synthase small subunit [Opitutia bacterium AMD-G1]|jgi:acetolactate synthase-1/3 small subunit|nr:MAG: acetolactate synthase small subunit [Opitutae bacterium AMD-G1]
MTPPKKKHTLSALVENKFGVLARVAGMLSGRGFNIETLNVGPTHDPAYSRITATVVADDAALDRCVKALDKLINVITVNDFSREEVDHVARELILVKVKSDKKTRTEILEIAGLFRAKVVDVAHDSLIIEFTGNVTKISAFLDLIEPFGIIETARTGAVALTRGLKKASK